MLQDKDPLQFRKNKLQNLNIEIPSRVGDRGEEDVGVTHVELTVDLICQRDETNITFNPLKNLTSGCLTTWRFSILHNSSPGLVPAPTKAGSVIFSKENLYGISNSEVPHNYVFKK